MTAIINKIFFTKYKAEVKDQILEKNILSSRILMIVIASISLLHIVYLCNDLGGLNNAEYRWHISTIYHYTALLSLSVILLVFQYSVLKIFPHYKKLLSIVYHCIYIFGFSITISYSVTNELYNNVAISYFMALVFVPLIIVLDFRYSLCYTLFFQMVFLILLSISPLNKEYLMNNALNSNVLVLLSLIIAYNNWSKFISEFKYKRTIDIQQERVQKQNGELFKLNEKLIEANSEKDKFFSIIAHDLRNPIGGFKSLLDELLNHYDDMDESEKREIIQMIKLSAANTYKLLEDLLEWAKAQMLDAKINKTDNDIIELINVCIKLNQTQLDSKQIKINLEAPEVLVVKLDYNLIKSALLNIITNAIKFTNNNGHIDIKVSKTTSDVKVAIIDNGVGMTNDQIENLFTLSKKQSTRGTQGEIGTGLGLILVKGIIEKHNGKIWVASELGRGTIITFSLPLI